MLERDYISVANSDPQEILAAFGAGEIAPWSRDAKGVQWFRPTSKFPSIRGVPADHDHHEVVAVEKSLDDLRAERAELLDVLGLLDEEIESCQTAVDDGEVEVEVDGDNDDGDDVDD